MTATLTAQIEALIHDYESRESNGEESLTIDEVVAELVNLLEAEDEPEKYTQFKESDHPRDEAGKFKAGDGDSGTSSPQPSPAPKPTESIAADFSELKQRHPELAAFSDNPDPLPKAKGGQIAHMTDRQHAIYSDLAKAKSAGKVTPEEWNAGLAAIRSMNEPGNQIAPPQSKVKSKLFKAMSRASRPTGGQ